MTQQTKTQGFWTHLADAIRINSARKPLYMARTGGRSRSLSAELIATERLCLPIAAYFDWRGRSFEHRGIPVVSGAFVPMQLAPAETRPHYSGRAGADTIAAAQALLASTGRRVGAALRGPDFRAAAQICVDTLVSLEALERESGSHFAMCKHLVESLGLGALCAIECDVRSGGRTVRLSRDLVAIQILALGKAADADRRAQEFQAMGVGILVNDMPAIPFLKRWAEQADKSTHWGRG